MTFCSQWFKVRGPQPGQGEGTWRNGVEVIEGTDDNKGEEGLASAEGGKEILAQQQKERELQQDPRRRHRYPALPLLHGHC